MLHNFHVLLTPGFKSPFFSVPWTLLVFFLPSWCCYRPQPPPGNTYTPIPFPQFSNNFIVRLKNFLYCFFAARHDCIKTRHSSPGLPNCCFPEPRMLIKKPLKSLFWVTISEEHVHLGVTLREKKSRQILHSFLC